MHFPDWYLDAEDSTGLACLYDDEFTFYGRDGRGLSIYTDPAFYFICGGAGRSLSKKKYFVDDAIRFDDSSDCFSSFSLF